MQASDKLHEAERTARAACEQERTIRCFGGTITKISIEREGVRATIYTVKSPYFTHALVCVHAHECERCLLCVCVLAQCIAVLVRTCCCTYMHETTHTQPCTLNFPISKNTCANTCILNEPDNVLKQRTRVSFLDVCVCVCMYIYIYIYIYIYV
jgi:hypothetical protein